MKILPPILLLIVLLIFGLAWYNTTQSERVRAEAQAEAMIIRSQSQARLDAATANAITLAATVPVLVVSGFALVGTLLGLALLVAAFRYRPASAPRLIERQVVYILPPPGSLPRREVWNLMSQEQAPILLESRIKEDAE